ncbi:hypothetical protein ACE6H2_006817 [Prunus campanulata]
MKKYKFGENDTSLAHPSARKHKQASSSHTPPCALSSSQQPRLAAKIALFFFFFTYLSCFLIL